MQCENCKRDIAANERVIFISVVTGDKLELELHICFKCIKENIINYLPVLKMFNKEAYETIKLLIKD